MDSVLSKNLRQSCIIHPANMQRQEQMLEIVLGIAAAIEYH